MGRQHSYATVTTWTGNLGTGTSTYRGYSRDHELTADGVPAIQGSSDPSFRGDPARWNPEQLLLTSLASCHMLSYLHLCAVNGIVVTEYVDRSTGTMEQAGDGGHFAEVTLHPEVTIDDADKLELAESLHTEAHKNCFIAASVNFPVRHEPRITVNP